MLKDFRTTTGCFYPETRFSSGARGENPWPPDPDRDWRMVGSAVTADNTILWFWEADVEDEEDEDE